MQYHPLAMGCDNDTTMRKTLADTRQALVDGLKQALPIMAGYIVLGLPCGLLCQQAGMDVVMVFLMSVLFYSGAGQYMISNMVLAGNPLASIVMSVSLVNSRQLLYATSLSRYCERDGRVLSFLFGATVTDESFGVNLARFSNDGWDVKRAFFVNVCSQSAWTISNIVGNLVGSMVAVPTAVASFAMTSIFICLLCTQKLTSANVIAALAAVVGVIACKCIGLSGPAILIGALFGIVCGYVCCVRKDHGRGVAYSCNGCAGSALSECDTDTKVKSGVEDSQADQAAEEQGDIL